jgi:Anti-sigma factor NepR
MSKKSKQPSKPQLDRTAQDVIGLRLRNMYSELVTQPIPERLLAILAIQDTQDALPPAVETLQRAA